MNQIKYSRNTHLDTTALVDAVGNRFDLILIACARAREIAAKHKEDGREGVPHAAITSLLEIQNGQIGREYLKKVRSK
jgi:DNA-directed RNA polymerase subunit K/omega